LLSRFAEESAKTKKPARPTPVFFVILVPLAGGVASRGDYILLF
jgi:hypothetical protein